MFCIIAGDVGTSVTWLQGADPERGHCTRTYANTAIDSFIGQWILTFNTST